MKSEPTPEAKRQAYRSSVVVRMPPGGSSAASDAGVVVKPNVTRLALVAALVAAHVRIRAVEPLRLTAEERYLRASLPGYDGYCAIVRWRLIPGFW